MYFDLMVIGGSGNAFGHSILNSLRLALPAFPPIKSIATPYIGFVLIVMLAVTYYILKYESVLWKKVMIITSAICIFPLTSTDYKLLHFLLPLFLLINHNDLPSEKKKNRIFLFLITLILIPKHYFYFYGSPFHNINNILNTLMIAISLLIIHDNPILFKKRNI